MGWLSGSVAVMVVIDNVMETSIMLHPRELFVMPPTCIICCVYVSEYATMSNYSMFVIAVVFASVFISIKHQRAHPLLQLTLRI